MARRPSRDSGRREIVPVKNVSGYDCGRFNVLDINKNNWEYPPAPRLRRAGMLVRYADAEDAAAKVIVKEHVAVYIEKVYEEGDFSGLGIGT